MVVYGFYLCEVQYFRVYVCKLHGKAVNLH